MHLSKLCFFGAHITIRTASQAQYGRSKNHARDVVCLLIYNINIPGGHTLIN